METETCLWILNIAQSENDTLYQGEDGGNEKKKNRFRKKDCKEFDGYLCLFVLEERMAEETKRLLLCSHETYLLIFHWTNLSLSWG